MIPNKKSLLFCIGILVVMCLLSFSPTVAKAEYQRIVITQSSPGMLHQNVWDTTGKIVDARDITYAEYTAGIMALSGESIVLPKNVETYTIKNGSYPNDYLNAQKAYIDAEPGSAADRAAAAAAAARGDAGMSAMGTLLGGTVGGPMGALLGGTVGRGLGLPRVPNVFDQAGNFVIWVISFSLYFVSLIFGILLYISGLLIDFFYSANQLASSDIVRSGWIFTRDTLNFVFILVLLVISFSTIAGLETFQMRKALPSLIFAALLVNFSLAIAGALLQVSNVITNSIASSILGTTEGENEGVGAKLTLGLVNSSDVVTFFTYENVEWAEAITGKKARILIPITGKDSPTNLKAAMSLPFMQYLQLTINSAIALVMIAVFSSAFIFLAILMAVRIVVLVILLILSPVPFVFSIIPKFKTYADKWWDNFIKYTIFLPAVTFFLALAIKLMSTKRSGETTPLVFQFFKEAPSVPGGALIGSIIDMVFVSIFIFASVLVAKALGIAGTKAAFSAAKKTGMAAAGIGVGLQAKAVGAAATSKYGEKFKVGTGLRAARSLGRTAQRGFGKVTGVGPSSIDDQIKTQQAALSGKSEDAIRAACKRGNAGACAKLADSGDLDKEDFPAAMMTIPKNTAAGNKMQKAYEKKDPVGAVLGSDVAGRFANGTATQADKDKANKKENKDKLNDGLKKMNKDDYAKMSAEDFKAIKNSGVNMPINRSQLSAVADSSNTELQKEVSKHVAELANKETETDPEKKLNPGQQAVLKEARKAGVFKDPASTPPPDPNRHPDPLIGPSPRP